MNRGGGRGGGGEFIICGGPTVPGYSYRTADGRAKEVIGTAERGREGGGAGAKHVTVRQAGAMHAGTWDGSEGSACALLSSLAGSQGGSAGRVVGTVQNSEQDESPAGVGEEESICGVQPLAGTDVYSGHPSRLVASPRLLSTRLLYTVAL